jgi:hypothetical protein
MEALMAAQVLSVGSCSADDYRLKRLVREQIDADFASVSTAAEALEAVKEQDFDLVLVNRIFDWDGTQGVDFIAMARNAGVKSAMMLISDYEDAQARAVANGALPGFGKSQLHDPALGELLRNAVQTQSTK